ncbi:sporulation inhibitor of replication protein SirA [Bacillus thermotolerans]|nr:sporulation inhibitor of replication protein SirA [Bacillus thermotolerans]
MRSYQIYWIGEEFAHYFYGREHSFFQLFFESTIKGKEEKSVIERQIQHITQEFSLSAVASALKKALGGKSGFSSESESLYKVELPKEKGKAVLLTKKHCLYLKASGSYEAETIFFHALKKLNACLFAVDFQQKNYGWLAPIKKEILFK